MDEDNGDNGEGSSAEEDEDVEIQEMKAKFNQILANFDQEH